MQLFRWDAATQGKVVEVALAEAEVPTNLYGGAELADWEQDISKADVADITFDLGQHFNLKPRTASGAGFDDGLSLAFMHTGMTHTTLAAKLAPSDIVIDANTTDASISEMSPTVDSTLFAPPALRGVRQGSSYSAAFAAIFAVSAARAASTTAVAAAVINDNVPPPNVINRQNATHDCQLVHTDLWGNHLYLSQHPRRKRKRI